MASATKRRVSRATDARRLALELTRAVRERDAYLRELVDARRGSSELSAEEFAFAQVLAFGVVMCRGTLDELIDRNLASPDDIRPDVRDALRVSAYELLFLDKPEHVAVDQGVELVRATARKATRLANAVLRKMARDARSFPWGDPAADAAAFARSFGVPEWLAGRFVADCGRQSAADMLAASLHGAPRYLRRNVYRGGGVFASDLSAQFVASLVPTQGSVLEIGAGRGTKTLLMQCDALDRRGAAADIHAVELHGYRARLLEERMERCGVPGVSVHVGDARDLGALADLPSSFDAVFVDAPCSGTGTLRRHPEIRWCLTPHDVDELARLQRELLDEAASRVKRGGTLVYATCSVLMQENEQVVEAFAGSAVGSGFRVDRLPQLMRAQRADAPGWRITDEGYFASLPSEGGPDGHFAARFTRA